MASKRMASVYVFLVVASCFSLLYGWVPILHRQIYVAGVAIFLSLFLVPKFFKSRLFVFIFFYAIIVWLNAQGGDEYAYDKKLLDGLMLCMCGGISYYLMLSNDQKSMKWICILLLCVLIIQTIPGLVMYFTAKDTIRTFINQVSHGEVDYEWDHLFRLGVLSYDVTHGLPLLVPPLIMWLRTKNIGKRWRIFCLISLICIFILTVIYDVTTVQFLALFGVGASLLIYPNQDKKNQQRIIIAAILVLPFILSSSLQNELLGGVESIASGAMKEKVADMRYDLNHDDGTSDLAGRGLLYGRSIDAFISSPIIGTDDYSLIGGHSAVFDRMGAFGLIGFIPFLFIFILSTRFCRKNMPPSSRWYYTICTICFLALIVMKNMCRLEEWLMYLVVVPSLLSLSPMTVGGRNAEIYKKIM